MRRVLLLASAFLSLAFAGEAAAAEIVATDNEGRQMLFDVRAEGVDVEWYAAILRSAPHGDEISKVRIEIVTAEELARTCSREANGCYRGNVVTVAAGQTDANARTLVHEYGHHLDASMPVAGAREPNGTSTWWRARGMPRLVALGSVYRGYERGWDRSIAEIFAEDYAQLALPGSPHGIRWLESPNGPVLDAIRFDLGLGPEPSITAPPPLKPVSIARRGRLAPRRAAAIPFGLLGPGRRVRATVTFAGAAEKGTRARVELRCDGTRVALKTIGGGRTSITLDRSNLGPAEECAATLTNTGRVARAYTLSVRLSVEL